MNFLKLIINKSKFDKSADRLGPDLPFTHWRLNFKPLMIKLCNEKFKHFGQNAEFRPGAYAIACSKISIGENVVIRPNTMLFSDPRPNGAEIIISDNVLIGSGVHFYTNNHRFDLNDKFIIEQGHYPGKTIKVNEGSWIGANAIILSGITIGKNAVVAAGSVVTKNVDDFTLVAGVPAKLLKKI